jgi:putative CocE/NonD family hydrolase
MRALKFLVVLATLAAAAPAGAQWRPGPPDYGIHEVRDVKVRMSDGVELAADVYYPADPGTGEPAAGRFPVILSQTPYAKRSGPTKSAHRDFGGNGYWPYLVRRGYINAVVDVRGTGSSGGDFELFGEREIRDGVELVHWAAGLERSSGKVGGAGESYLGLNQIFTAATIGRGSPLKAIFPVTAGHDLYRDLAFGGGIPNVLFAAAFAGLRAGMVAAPPDDPAADPFAIVRNPTSRGQGFAQLDASLYAEVDTGGPRAFDHPFWQGRAPRRYLRRVVANGIPAFMVSGWFDVYQRGVALNYAALQNAWARRKARRSKRRPARRRPPSLFAPMARGQRPTPRYQLAMGPWFHDPTGLGERYQELMLEWFDSWLKGTRTGMRAERKPLHVYELRGRRWIDAARYPLPGAPGRTMYLGKGTLAPEPPAEAGSDRIAWSDAVSPCNRNTDQWNTGLGAYVLALAGMPANPCATDDRTTQAGALTYTSEPLERDLTIAGPISATLHASATSRDAVWVVTVEDVGPDGSSYPLTTGALLGSHRALDETLSWRDRAGKLLVPYHPYTSDAARDVDPGAVERYDVEVYPTFARIAAGHRLRVTITTAASHLHPSPAQVQKLAGGVYELRHGGEHASHVNLPLAEPGAMRTSAVSYGDCQGEC